ncbi:MAG TPA: hypothetical protein VHV30_07770 [Polyangiaceae bacterium]|jgi:hypothetical protein|nr:hypothetical protein [Polyangiaceae bacterium]
MLLRRIVTGVFCGASAIAALGMIDGCLTRPVISHDPVTKTNFITSIPQGSIDKVDILFDIDNSASMGDKQAYLSYAVPDLLGRLVTPNCLDANGVVQGVSDQNGNCTNPAWTPEFPPVHNMHIGILSSSLGGRLGSGTCPTTGMLSMQALANNTMISRHNDDQAHLLNRTADPMALTNYAEGTSGAATAPDNFIDWFPSSNPNNSGKMGTGSGPEIADPATLTSDFAQLVVGVHQFGCGIESQLETWYRFLIQPDPYGSLGLDKTGKIAEWVGVDTTLLAQRADFLRPDSLVAILVLTDENDSEVDVRSFGGTAWNFMSNGFQPPRGTSACQSNNPATVASSACTSCAFGNNKGDSSCQMNGGVYPTSVDTDWGYDLNLRHVHEKQKYGASVQFPIMRYVLGLTSSKVPNRDGEYPPVDANAGTYSSQYEGLKNLNCVNPLFAASLPKPPNGDPTSWNPTADDLCNLSPGSRNPNLIFYAHIGGVPHQLLQENPSDVNSPQKASLTDADWQLILGKDPENWDYTGIDPHMAESYDSRISGSNPIAVPPGDPLHALADTTATGTNRDPISGREWVTNSTMAKHAGLVVDREYSCIFQLVDRTTGTPTPRDCSDAATAADPTLLDSCDCTTPYMGTGSFTPAQIPAVCNDAKPTEQDYAKAYPTIRELEVAHLLGSNGGNPGIVSSLCPIHTYDMMGGTDPLFGYRPAVNAIIAALSKQLSHTCLPERLQVDPATGLVPCLVLGTFPSGGGSGGPANCDAANPQGIKAGTGWSDPDPTILAHFREDQHAQWQAQYGGAASPPPDPSTELTCQLTQLPPDINCSTGDSDGWCYGDTAGFAKGCTQAILFNSAAQSGGVTTSLQCIEASSAGDGGTAAVVGNASSSGGSSSSGSSSGTTTTGSSDSGTGGD